MFGELQIEVKNPPFNLDAVAPPSRDDIDRARVDLADFFEGDDQLNAAYVEFVAEHGPGTLGRVKILSPTTNIAHPADVRLHALLLRKRVSETKFQHNFEMQSLLPFAFDVREGMWFAWSTSGKRKSSDKVFVFDDKHDSAPPRCVAENFDDFLRQCALGSRMVELDIRKPRNVSDGEEDDDDNAHDAAASAYEPPKTFVRFAGNSR
jgi:hypothetical protein